MDSFFIIQTQTGSNSNNIYDGDENNNYSNNYGELCVLLMLSLCLKNNKKRVF